MKKSEMIEAILKASPRCQSVYIVRVYGVSCGVGYDISTTFMFEGGHILDIEAHASHHGWAYPNHLRPNNPYYKYTGKNDRYQERVINFWKNGLGFESYLNELKKKELEVIYNYVMDEVL